MTALDANVLIYACDSSDPRRQELANQLIERARQLHLLSNVSFWDAMISGS